LESAVYGLLCRAYQFLFLAMSFSGSQYKHAAENPPFCAPEALHATNPEFPRPYPSGDPQFHPSAPVNDHALRPGKKRLRQKMKSPQSRDTISNKSPVCRLGPGVSGSPVACLTSLHVALLTRTKRAALLHPEGLRAREESRADNSYSRRTSLRRRCKRPDLMLHDPARQLALQVRPELL
jgi:hypothetical protein